MIISSITNPDELLAVQPNLLQFNQDIFKLASPCVIPAILIYFSVLFYFYSLCVQCYKTNSSIFSSSSQETNKVLFKSITFQLITMFFFVICPLMCMVITAVVNISPGLFFYFSTTVIWSFPVIDDIVIILTIKSYRKFLFDQLNSLKNLFHSRVGMGAETMIQYIQSTRVES